MDIADAYYRVAADLKERGEFMLRQAETLAQMADRICEQRMREGKPVSAGDKA